MVVNIGKHISGQRRRFKNNLQNMQVVFRAVLQIIGRSWINSSMVLRQVVDSSSRTVELLVEKIVYVIHLG